jgi:hypothetical protein
LCEHLDVAADTFDDLLTEKGSLLATVEALRGDGRTLMPFEPDTVEGEDSPLAESELMDPERTPPSIWERTNWTRFRRRLVRRRKAAGSLQA